MNWLDYLKALVMGAVEGITEFLPVSSTGHLIVTGRFIHFTGPLVDTFEVSIQLGAILSVCWLYRHKLFTVARGLPYDPAAQRFAFNLLVAFMPAAVLGFFFSHSIKAHLFSPLPVAIAFIVGGLVILAVERMHLKPHISRVDDMRWRDALKVGCAQIFALIPGTSRSGATIIGGLIFGLSRPAATEFSFFLAIPTMFAATFYDVYKHAQAFDSEQLGIFAVGFVVAFLSALLAVKSFIRYVGNHDFSVFAWYRIVSGAIVLWYFRH